MALIAHFKLDGNTIDRVGTYSSNTATNITYTTSGKIDGAAIFNGSSSALTLSSTINIASNANWTVSVWVKFTSTASMSILSNSSGGPVSNDLRIESGRMMYWHYNGAWFIKQGNIVFNDGNWHHLTWVNFSNNKMNMYVDGVLDQNQIDSTQSAPGPVNQIGKNWTTNYFNGTMDDFRLYNDADLGKITSLNFNEKLVGHWPLIGNTNDYSGYGNNATNFGATVSTTIGKIGSSYQFNGTSHYMTINNPVKAATNWTISFWFRRNGSFAWSDILTFNTGVDGTAARIEQSGSVINEYFWFVATGFPSGSLLWVTAGDNIWEHITLVVNDTTARSFKNGVLQYSYAKNINPLPSSNLINIGRRLTSQYLGMYLNDLRMYNYALSEYEVKELAKANIVHYTFDNPEEEPTVNHVPDAATMPSWSPYSAGNDGTFITQFGTTGYRINNRLTWNGLLRSVTVPAPGVYTFSAWFRYFASTGGNNGATVYISGYGGSDTATALNKNIVGVWQRISRTFTATNTTFTLYLISYGGTAGTDRSTWDVTMPQLELKSAMTPFVEGTRSIGIADLSGLKYNNFPTTAITPIWSSISKLGSNSILFNGSLSHHLNLTEISAMPFNTGMSFSVWAYPTASSSWARFIDFGNGPSSDNILFAREGTNTTIRLHSYNGSTSTSILATSAIENNVWQHFAFTIAANGAAKIYKNGVVIVTGTLHVPNVITRNNMYIGRSNWTGDAFYNGNMDNIELYTTTLSDADVLALYNRRANFDNLGNVSINEIDNTRSYFQPLIDYSTWTVGQTSATGWSRNGTEAENIILLKENPVNQTDIMWATLGNDATSDADGGFNSTTGAIDRTKKYRYSIWIKRENIGNGRTYFGCGGNTVSNLGAGEVLNSNPYFTNYISSEKSNIGEQWVLIVAHIHPTGYTGGTDTVSGFYDINGNKISSISTDYKWASTATVGSIRAYLFYSTSTTERQYFYRPRIDLLDGNEPALQDLINCSDNPVLYEKTVADINKKALFNNNGQALFRDIDEVTGTQNTNAKQEITNNGTLLINGEFSEVD
jgi:hypothetical protein